MKRSKSTKYWKLIEERHEVFSKILKTLGVQYKNLQKVPKEDFFKSAESGEIAILRYKHNEKQRIRQLKLIVDLILEEQAPKHERSFNFNLTSDHKLEETRVNAELLREKIKKASIRAFRLQMQNTQQLIQKIKEKQERAMVRREQLIKERPTGNTETHSRVQVTVKTPRPPRVRKIHEKSITPSGRASICKSESSDEDLNQRIKQFEAKMDKATMRSHQFYFERSLKQRIINESIQNARKKKEKLQHEQEKKILATLKKKKEKNIASLSFEQRSPSKTFNKHKRFEALKMLEKEQKLKEERLAARLKDFYKERNRKLVVKTEKERLSFDETLQNRKILDKIRIKRNTELLEQMAKRNQELDHRKQKIEEFEQSSRQIEYNFLRESLKRKEHFTSKARKIQINNLSV